jgi:hypothetical protein
MEPRGRAIGSARAGIALVPLALLLLALSPASAGAPVQLSPASGGARVLRVGTFHGIQGQFRSIQKAVDAAHKGDWILIGPGDYHERADFTKRHHAPRDEPGAAVLIKKNRLHLRGMNRNKVIVDGTKPGSKPCSSRLKDQSFGPKGKGGKPVGRTGIVAFKASGVTIDNLTACNFLAGGIDGNQIWWNGGDGSGKIGMGAWYGNYLSATSTFFKANKKQAGYGLFASNARGPGKLTHSYASNMNDAGVYIGACRRVCNSVVTRSQFEFNSLGYSGTNAGGSLVLKDSEWDHNATGIVTNSQNNDDAPSPQDGACPEGGTGPTGTYSCLFIKNNSVHDNNNSHVPVSSSTPSPIGTGIVISGGRDDTVMKNDVAGNDAWGILLVPWPDFGPPPPIAHCQGGTPDFFGPGTCFYDDWGNQVDHNTLSGNGSLGNPTNGDLAEGSLPEPTELSNCWFANKHPDGSDATAAPSNLQTAHGEAQCGQPQTTGGDPDVLTQAGCASRVLDCPAGTNYPKPGKVRLHKLPHEKSMPNPCKGVPHNPWCPGRQHH